jgi:hypothetical protein
MLHSLAGGYQHSSETLVTTYKTTRHHNPENHNLQYTIHLCLHDVTMTSTSTPYLKHRKRTSVLLLNQDFNHVLPTYKTEVSVVLAFPVCFKKDKLQEKILY